jgi:hypothetical protein
MSKVVKNKLCWNCEGNVSRDAANCKYCGVYLHRDDDDDDDIYEDEIEEEVKAPTSPPPTTNPGPTLVKPVSAETAIPRPPYNTEKVVTATLDKNSVHSDANYVTALKTVVAPLVLLSAGSVFVIFAFLLYFFSSNGVLQLQWNSSYWFYYLLAALPLLFFGWKFLVEQKED